MRFQRFIALSLIVLAASSANAADYCLAIRGNGEAEPAHWGAVSNVVERLGLPKAQAGGSSASITMFLLDAMATNPLVKNAGSEGQRRNAALLVKSLEGFLNYITTTDEFRDFKLMYGDYQKFKDAHSVSELQRLLGTAAQAGPQGALGSLRANADVIRRNYEMALEMGFLNAATMESVRTAIENSMNPQADAKSSYQSALRARFLLTELMHTIQVLGAFDASTDANLFFRQGLVDFNQFAGQVGRIGDFYSGIAASVEEKRLWGEFMSECSRAAVGKLWSELPAACGQKLTTLIQTHFSGRTGDFSERAVGFSIPSFPTTAILTGSAQEEVAAAFVRYNQAMDSNFGGSFRLSDPEQVRFGYWGREDMLAAIPRALPNDEKSRRFMALGSAPWHEVLSLSPAEPGLSPLKFFSHGEKTFVSAGGWADLQPVLILRAAGCNNVVYVTRRGGESLFAQGVAKRLLGYDRDWSVLQTTPADVAARNQILNNQGDASDQTSLWSKLYNLGNPNSSFKRSLGAADAVLCTDWDAYDVKTGLRDLVRDGYNAPYFVREGSGLAGSQLSPLLNPADQNPSGYPKFAGCF